jgi:hypothetical protein
MLNIVKSGNAAIEEVSQMLPKSLLFWGVVGAAVASSSVFLIKPLRKSLLALLGFKAARKVARKVATRAMRQHKSTRATSHRTVRHRASARRPRLAHAH